MKLSTLFSVSAVVLLFCSCASKKEVVQTSTAKSPFGETFTAPCTVYDTDDEFAATGIFRGSSLQMGEVHANALTNAQEIVKQKFHHSFHGMISNYSSSIGNNRGNDIEAKMQRAGDQVLEGILNDTKESCTQYSEVFDDGNVQCYVAIKVSKTDLAQKTAKKINDNLTKEEKEAIKFDEYQYRKQMEERLRQYKEEENK